MRRLLKKIRELRACSECAAGDWVPGENGGYRRCHAPGCLRGLLLSKADGIRVKRDALEVELEVICREESLAAKLSDKGVG